ncbi:MAG TPA: GNAT family N-acetyltransferase [Amaricoccus sp.]|uniref:GNAT family N-acetyltransferase n=1 Tax=Amaricoccus sp. TaxID=1872485 RepID=UPI002CF6C0F2|nr:GNAT family N-acetyltransferase [Amaricoccus sp.]HRO11958.1 GNAT family N-acetyltransferase [Amaricoccus sp.]
MTAAPVPAPVIETERLRLRPHRLEDFPPLAAFYGSAAARFVGGPLPADRAWHVFASDVGAWDLVGSGAWGLEEKATGAFAGQLAANRAPHFPEPEIGWILLPGFEGRGYAAEGARAVRAFAYGTLGWETAVSYVDPGNRRSVALARRLGCVEDPDARPLYPQEIVFRHPGPAALEAEAPR